MKKYKNGYSIKIKPFLSYHSVIQTRILRLVIANQTGSLKDIHYKNIQDIIELFYRQSGKMIFINQETMAIREHHFIRIIKVQKSSNFAYNLTIGFNEAIQYNKKIEIILQNDSKIEQRRENTYTKKIDYDKISGNLQIRTRQPGDRILLKNGSKKLKDFFIDEKIPRTSRDEVLLIADGSNIIWVVGYRLSEAYYITNQTKRVLQIKISDLTT